MLLQIIYLVLSFLLFKRSKARSLANNKFVGWRNKPNKQILQVKFIDTMKYCQQSLSTLAATMTETEKQNIKIHCKKFINRDKKLNQKFLSCSLEEQEWILVYLSSGKETIPCEMITNLTCLIIYLKKSFFPLNNFTLG